jgi:chemotaxis protein MotB
MRRSILLLAVVLGSCVAKTQYDSALSDLDEMKAELAKADAARIECEERQATLEEQLGAELSATKEELEELRRQREEIDKQFAELTAKLQEMIDAGDLQVYMRRGLIMIGLPSQILFPSGKAELSERGQKALGKIATVLATMPDRRIEVAGHTDDEPIGEKLKTLWQDNWQLSTARALTVTRFLVGKGMKPESLTAAGNGEFDPVADNKKADGRKKNRRIELILVPDLSGLGKAAGAKGK